MKEKTIKKHWTERSIKDYVFRIAADLIAQLEKKIELFPITQDELAKRLGVTKGRVSQFLNRPGNFGITQMVKYARALGMKASIVAYDDNDPENKKGPINSEIFKMCWEQLGKPRDFWAMQDIAATNNVLGAKVRFGRRINDFKVSPAKQTSWGNVVACPQYVSIERSAGNQKELPS